MGQFDSCTSCSAWQYAISSHKDRCPIHSLPNLIWWFSSSLLPAYTAPFVSKIWSVPPERKKTYGSGSLGRLAPTLARRPLLHIKSEAMPVDFFLFSFMFSFIFSLVSLQQHRQQLGLDIRQVTILSVAKKLPSYMLSPYVKGCVCCYTLKQKISVMLFALGEDD